MPVGRALLATGCRRAAVGACLPRALRPAHPPPCTALSGRSGSGVTSRNRVAATTAVRSFATDSAASSAASYELLKKDFRKWLSKEAQVLSLLLVVGTTGVYFYKVWRK